MLGSSEAFSGFAVPDVETAKKFYEETLGLKVAEEMGGLSLDIPGSRKLFIYSKPDHEPANYTILNFPVDDIDAAVDELASRGFVFERYEGFDQDDKGIARSSGPNQGPDIAWFTDPAGNIMSVLK